jgi:hypothetical protein
MAMIRPWLAAAAALTLCGSAALAQTPPPGPAPAPPAPPAAPARSSADFWAISDTRIASVPARIAFPRRAGAVEAYRHQEFSHEGEGIDNAVQYRSADGAVYATVYVYYPGLAHSGLAAFATDLGLRATPQFAVTGGEMRVVDAGGRTGVAIRADYSRYRGDETSSAAWIKTGRWIIKFRVSGPEARRAEVMAAMDALLRDVQFGVANPPYPAAPLTISDCPAGSGTATARILPEPPAAELAAQGMLATFDGGGLIARDAQNRQSFLPSRLPERFCRTVLTTRGGTRTILRAEPGEARSIDGRTMLIIAISDSGRLLELVKADNLGGHVLLHHEIGRTTVLVRYDGVPSNAQIVDMLDRPNHPAMRVVVPVDLRPDTGPRIHLPGAPAAPVPARSSH